MPRVTCFSVDPNYQRFTSEDGKRWALGRNVKGEAPYDPAYGPGARWRPVEVWTLKRRDENGKAIVVRSGASREEAINFVTFGMTLSEFATRVNQIAREKASVVQSGLFKPEHVDYPESMLRHYWEFGFTPDGAAKEISLNTGI